MGSDQAQLHLSVSTWQQPSPPPASPQRGALIKRVTERVLALGPGRLRVSIDGRTASGKTSFGHEVAEQVIRSGRQVLRASLDDFKKPRRDRHRYDRESGEGYYRNAFDYDAVARLLLEPLRPGGSGECALCGIDPLTQADHSAVRVLAAPDAVLIVDGVFAFRPEINGYWDYRVWLDVDPETSIQRGTSRDRDMAGTDGGAIHRDRYLPAERRYIDEVDPLRVADLVIDNAVFDRPRIIRG